MATDNKLWFLTPGAATEAYPTPDFVSQIADGSFAGKPSPVVNPARYSSAFDRAGPSPLGGQSAGQVSTNAGGPPDGPPASAYLQGPPVRGPIVLNERNRDTGQGDGRFGMNRIARGHPRMHQGVDIQAEVGTPVMAADDGVVTVRADPSGYGHEVLVDNGHGRVTRYGHLSDVHAQSGDRVQAGTVIGSSGRSGNVPPHAQPHLHFEVIVDGHRVDPMTMIPQDDPTH